MSNAINGPFDILNDIPKNKLYDKQDVEKHLNISLLIKWLSNHNVGLSIAEYLNRNFRMNIYDMYLFTFYILPTNIKKIKYNKRDKKEPLDDLKYITQYYNCSEEVAKDYYRQMSDKSFKKIKAIISAQNNVKLKGEDLL